MNAQRFGERTLLFFSVAAAVALLFTMSALSLLSLRSALRAGDLYAHTLDVLKQEQNVANGLTAAATARSGFLLSGDEYYLGRYQEAVREVPGELAALRQKTKENPSQQRRLQRLSEIADAQIAAMRETIDAYQAGDRDGALRLFRLGRVRSLAEQARVVLEEFEAEENALLARRLSQRDDERQQTFVAFAAASGLAILLLGAAAIVLFRSVRRLQLAERSRRESEQRLSVTLTSIGDAVIATNTEGRVTFMNPVAQEMTGWGEREAKGRSLAEVFHIINEETRNLAEHPVEKVLRSGRIVGLANHTVLIRRDGRETPIDDSAAPIRDGDGEIMGVVLVFHDVSERKELQANRERYLLAEASNQAKDQFLAMLSHELRSPLNAMLGWVRLLQRNGAQKEIYDRALEVLDRNIGMQTKLINELLDMSRVVSGKLKLDFETVDLTTLVRDCADSTRPTAEAKGIALEKRVAAGDTDLIVRGDRERLHQVVCNLLDNAIKFTPAHGRVRLSLQRLGSSAELTVSDDGEGIPFEFLPHVFERFRQADARLSRTHGGLGIGLAIVQHLVQRHGGRVTAHSDGPGTGASFTVLLPLTQLRDPLPAGNGEEREGPQPSTQTILLVEDDPDTLEALRLTLAQSGARVFAASNAADALEIVDRQPLSLIVSDISMPGCDGYQLIRAIRKRQTRRTPAIAMTGLASNEDRSAAIAAGFDEYFTKPVDPEKLLSFIREL